MYQDRFHTGEYISRAEQEAFCSFGITEVVTAALVSAGVGAGTAAVVAPVLTGALTGSLGGGALSAATGGHFGTGALEGALTGGAAGGLGGALGTLGSTATDAAGTVADTSGAAGDFAGGLDPSGSLTSLSAGAADGGALSASDGALSGLGSSLGTDGGLSGLSSSLGNVGSDFNGGLQGGSDLTSLTPEASRVAVSGTATAPVGTAANLTGYLPGTGSSSIGGGTSGGFLDVSPTGSGPGGTGLTGQFAQGLADPAASGGNLAGDFSGGLAPSNAPGGQFSFNTSPTSGSSMLSNIPVGNNLLNSLLKGGLGYALQKNNTGGYGALQNASNQSANSYLPFVQNGQAATNQLANLNGLNGQAAAQSATQQWQNTPGYQFAFNQGLQGIDAGAAQRGMLNSGNNLQAEQTFGTGLANQYYQNYLGQLNQQAGLGANAAAGYGSGITNAAGAYSAGKGQQVGNTNTLSGGLLNSLFPTGGLNINPSGNGGYNAASNNNGGLSSLLSGLFNNGGS